MAAAPLALAPADPALGGPIARRDRRRLRGDDGNSAIELAFLAPVVLLLIFVIIQFALIEYGRTVALDSAREAASTLRLSRQADCQAKASEIADETATYAHSLGSSGLIDPTVTPACGANQVSVTVSGHAVSLVPGLTITVKQTVNRQVEQFVPDDEEQQP